MKVCGMSGRSYNYAVAHAISKKFGSALIRLTSNCEKVRFRLDLIHR